MSNPISYKDAGVDIEKGDELVSRIKKKVTSTYGDRVYEGVGGFACLYKITDDKLLAAGTDGVGTKIKIAQQLGIHNTIGIDLVAMCANDTICTGAKNLFFMDYLACGSLDLGTSEAILDGVIEGCKQSEMALIGGETAEMPGVYPDGEYDLAGFAVGEVMTKDLIDGNNVAEGHSIVGISSSGVHSNGFSLVRKLIKDEEVELLTEVLTPTKIYCKLMTNIQNEMGSAIKGLAHVTGGGLLNLPRINDGFDYYVNSLPDYKSEEFKKESGRIFEILAERSGLSDEELYKTFNMGIGLAIITDDEKTLMSMIEKSGNTAYLLGKVVKGKGNVFLPNGRTMS